MNHVIFKINVLFFVFEIEIQIEVGSIYSENLECGSTPLRPGCTSITYSPHVTSACNLGAFSETIPKRSPSSIRGNIRL